MNIEQLNVLKKKLDDECKVTPDNAMEKSLSIINIRSEICSIFIKEKNILNKMKIERDKLKSKLYHHYKYEFDFALDSNKEIEMYIDGNEDFYKKCLEINNQTTVVEFFEQYLTIINTAGYAIKAYLEFYKIKMGIGY